MRDGWSLGSIPDGNGCWVLCIGWDSKQFTALEAPVLVTAAIALGTTECMEVGLADVTGMLGFCSTPYRH